MSGVCDDSQFVGQPRPAAGRIAGERVRQLGGDRALAGPPVHEQDVMRVVPGDDVVERDGVDAAPAHDGNGVVRQLNIVCEQGPPAHQDANGSPGPG